MTIRRAVATFGLVALAAAGPPVHAQPRPAPVVIGLTEPGGLNVLHTDYRAPAGAELPAGIPGAVEVTLPVKGTFAQRMKAARAGVLGKLKPRTLYHVAGTRLLIYVPSAAGPVDVFEDRIHATGTTAAAIGAEHGTAPDAWLVYVPRASEAGWSWLAQQRWIDVISTSYYPLVAADGRCHPARHIRSISEQGRVVFAAAGNHEHAGFLSSPSGTPAAYQVGGVDDGGRSFLPSRPDPYVVSPTRPYETGDRFDFPSADSESLTGSMPFGGTSGAAPSTAGRAATLIARTRSLLGDRTVGLQDGALASGRAAGGLLADGALTSDELVDVLHQAAVPAEPSSPLRYLVEGYGAHDGASIDHAFEILTGAAGPVPRPDEDAMHDRVEAVREAAHSAACS